MNEIEIVIKGTDKSAGPLNQASANAKRAGSEMAAAQGRVAKATKEAGQAALSAQRAQLDLAAAQQRVERATVAAAGAEEKYGAESLQAREAATRLARAELEQAAAGQKVTDAAQRAVRAQVEEREAAQSLAAAQGRAAASAEGMGRAELGAAKASGVAAAETRGAARAADGAAGSTGRLASVMAHAATVAKVAFAGGLLAVGVAAAATIKIGIDYQQQLNMMQAVTHANAATMADVAKKARDLGNDLTLPATSAGDAAHAMTELAKGNLTAQQAMDAAKGTLQLAAAAQIDGATAATIQADALNAFSLKASQAGHVADVLANAANAATGEIGDFAQGLQASSAVAHQFGLTVDDTVTALALFANAGIHGSDAGTSLKSALLALASPSAQAADALKVLNLHAFDARGRFVGLESIAQQLATAQGRLTQKTFAAATATAFGSDAARAAGVLASAGAAGWEKMAAGISRSGGAATAAQAQMKGVGGALAGIKSELETISIDVFTAMAPSLERFLHWVADLIPPAIEHVKRLIGDLKAGFGDASKPVFEFVKGMAAVEDTLAPIGAILPAINVGMKPLKDAVAGIGVAGDGMAKGLKPVSLALNGFGASAKGAADVFTSMAPMIGETGQLMGDAVKPIGPLMKAAGADAQRSGLHEFFYNVGKSVGQLIMYVRQNTDTWKEWGRNLATAAGIIRGFIVHVIDVGKWLAKFPGWVVPIVGGLAAMAGIIRVLVAVTRTWAVVQAALDAVMLANPIGAIIVAIVGLTVAFTIAWKRSETFREVMSKVFTVLIPLAGLLIGPIVAIGLAITEVWKKSETFRDVIMGAFRGAATVVLEAARFIMDAVLGMVIGVLHAAGKMPGPLGAPFRAAEKAVRAFRDTADKQMSAAQARIDAWGRAAARPVRKDITVRVIDRATGVLTSITRYADALSGRIVSFTVGAVRGPNVTGNAHGGIVGAATGGVHGGLRWVGEQGPELVRLPYGSTVYPSGQSMGMAAAAGGGGGPVVFEIHPGGTGLDRLFVDWLRHAVRTRGGVDVVFKTI